MFRTTEGTYTYVSPTYRTISLNTSSHLQNIGLSVAPCSQLVLYTGELKTKGTSPRLRSSRSSSTRQTCDAHRLRTTLSCGLRPSRPARTIEHDDRTASRMRDLNSADAARLLICRLLTQVISRTASSRRRVRPA